MLNRIKQYTSTLYSIYTPNEISPVTPITTNQYKIDELNNIDKKLWSYRIFINSFSNESQCSDKNKLQKSLVYLLQSQYISHYFNRNMQSVQSFIEHFFIINIIIIVIILRNHFSRFINPSICNDTTSKILI